MAVGFAVGSAALAALVYTLAFLLAPADAAGPSPPPLAPSTECVSRLLNPVRSATNVLFVDKLCSIAPGAHVQLVKEVCLSERCRTYEAYLVEGSGSCRLLWNPARWRYTAEGSLVATVAQETLIRVKAPGRRAKL